MVNADLHRVSYEIQSVILCDGRPLFGRLAAPVAGRDFVERDTIQSIRSISRMVRNVQPSLTGGFERLMHRSE